MKDILANLRYSIEVEHDALHHTAQLEAIDKISQLFEEELKQAKEEVASLFSTIEAMYPELRQVYWKAQPWQSLKDEHLKG